MLNKYLILIKARVSNGLNICRYYRPFQPSNDAGDVLDVIKQRNWHYVVHTISGVNRSSNRSCIVCIDVEIDSVNCKIGTDKQCLISYDYTFVWIYIWYVVLPCTNMPVELKGKIRNVRKIRTWEKFVPNGVAS